MMNSSGIIGTILKKIKDAIAVRVDQTMAGKMVLPALSRGIIKTTAPPVTNILSDATINIPRLMIPASPCPAVPRNRVLRNTMPRVLSMIHNRDAMSAMLDLVILP
jgi:hypothetical protein